MDMRDDTATARSTMGFRTVAELAALEGVVVLDPASTLLGADVRIAPGAVLHPDVVIEASDGAHVSIGARSILRSGVAIAATAGAGVRIGRDVELAAGGVTVSASGGGAVSIGDGARIGPGGVTVIAESGTVVTVGAWARVRAGAWVEGPADLGDGAQVLGAVQLRDVVLGAGGAWSEPDPDRRGGVVKGVGRLHGARVGVGEVVELGRVPWVIERQRAHHPEAPRS